MHADSKRIGLFGGTFDPVHNGHLSIARSFLESGHIDELWVLLNPSPPHKPDESFAPFGLRLQMLKAAFSELTNVIVSDLETRLPAPTYTLQTVVHLTKKNPAHSLSLCMGKDSYLTFNTWHQWKSILGHCNLLVAERPLDEEEYQAVPSIIKKKTSFVEHSPVEISSTDVRVVIQKGEDASHLLPQAVADIIEEYHLYQ